METLADDVDRIAVETEFSGVVRVDRGNRVELAKAYGLAHRGLQIPNTVDTQFAVASAVKGMTALAVISLVVEGSLDLSTPARSVLGTDLPLIDDGVTVEHLLAHRSGIGDYLDEDEEHDYADYLMTVPVHELVNTEHYLPMLEGHPTKFPPGEQFSYCNGGFVVLALIAERVSGTPFHDLVAERVCKPAGMIDTAFLRTDELPGRAAMGYLEVDGVWRSNVFHLPVRGNGDGGDLHDGGRHPIVVDGILRRTDRARRMGGGDGAPPQRDLRSGALRTRVLARRFGRRGAAGGLRRRRVVP